MRRNDWEKKKKKVNEKKKKVLSGQCQFYLMLRKKKICNIHDQIDM